MSKKIQTSATNYKTMLVLALDMSSAYPIQDKIIIPSMNIYCTGAFSGWPGDWEYHFL